MCLFILRFYCSGGMHTRFGLGSVLFLCSRNTECLGILSILYSRNTECFGILNVFRLVELLYVLKVVQKLNIDFTLLN